MAIRRMISRDPAEFRAFQARMTTVGRIRLGVFATPEGRRGRPEKLDTFRFTADNEALIRAVAEEYGGTPEQWTPQGAKTPQWQVVTDAKAVEVYVVNGQNIDPVYEAWAGGRTCVRRCDGEWEQIKQDACLCNGPARPSDVRELCKITVRVQVMLQRVQGLGSWLLESHGENAAMELATFGPFIANAPMPVPAMLRLRAETRRQWNVEKGKFDTLNFFVPWFDVSAVNARTIAIGGDALTQALSAAGAPSAIGGGQAAIEARPVSGPASSTAGLADAVARNASGTGPGTMIGEAMKHGSVGAGGFIIGEDLRAAILADIEAQTTAEGLNAIRDKLVSRSIGDQRVKDAWASKEAAVRAAAQVTRPYRVLVTGSRTWTDNVKLNEQLDIARMVHPGRMVLVHGACPQGADALADTWAEMNGIKVERYPADWDGQGKSAGFIRNGAMVNTRPDVVLAFIRNGSPGATHCAGAAENAGLKVLRFTDDTPIEREAPEPVYGIGDTVNVGGIEFTKISDNPFPPGTPAAQLLEQAEFEAQQEEALNPDPGESVDGTVEATPGRVTLPDVPAGDYDADELYTMLMTGAGQQTPPLTTGEVNRLILNTFYIEKLADATGHDLARLRAGLKSGAVSWR